jgi:predicted nucleotidyltransferase
MFEIVDRLRNALRGREDVELALLFGSAARGEAREDSDVDVAVLAPSVDLLALASALGETIGCEVDLTSLDERDITIPLLAEIVRDAVVLHEGKPGAHARWRAHALTTLETDGPWYRRMRDAFVARLASTTTPSDPAR